MANFENQPNKEELMRMGIQAARNKQRQPARMMFEQVLNQDPDNVRALMWMAKISNSPEDRAHWLERVLEVEPDNETALRVLGRMEQGEDARRNKLFLQLAAGVYVVLLPVVMLLIVIPALT
jgi:lipopolysaccharide biosynthesis regulator YciM